ncbi:MAG: MFS transporter [Methanobacteriota archaeon]|nr:MAG: MFS transporter [Euryarchaeota archaeon]
MRPEAIQLLSSAGTFGPIILVPVILAEDFGESEAVIGLVVGIFAAASFLSSYACGRAADIYGRRVVLLLGLSLSAIVTLLHILTLWMDSLYLFVLVRVLLGFTAGMFPAALLAYVYEAKSKMGKFSSWGAAGWGIGSLGIGMFGTLYNWAFLYCAIILSVSFGIALTLPFPKEKRIHVPKFPIRVIRENAPVYASMIVRHTGANMIWVTYPLFLMSVGANEALVGAVYAVNAFSQFFIMNFLDRFDPPLLVAFGIGASSATFLIFALTSHYWEIIPAQILLAVSWSCLYVGSLRYVMDKSEEKATATGLLAGSMSISGILGPLIGGFTAAAIGFRGTMLAASAMAVVALVVFVYELLRSGEIYRLTRPSRMRR